MATQPPKEQTKLLICGSRRKVSDTMSAYAVTATQRAESIGWQIIVGDAVGIDKTVVETVARFRDNIRDYMILYVVYVTREPRLNVQSSNLEYHLAPARNFTERDRYMVENSDKIMCIWNGKSESSGTYKNYLYACELGKQAWLVNEHGKIIKTNEA